jgi:homogentisate 1,2-dioxygenase
MTTMVANRSPEDLEGVAVHIYRANRDMERRFFADADGELLFIPQQGMSPKITGLCSGFPSSDRSARTASPMRAIS